MGVAKWIRQCEKYQTDQEEGVWKSHLRLIYLKFNIFFCTEILNYFRI